MNNAEAYQKNNAMQKRDALLCLLEYGSKIKWKRSGERIIDIGCGDGSVAMDILRKFVPSNFKKIVGCDISEEMVKFCNDHHSRDDMEFEVLDITGELPEIMRNTFDHVVSFYTLHWVKHQEKAFKNIYELLTEGGGCWLMFVGRMILFEVWQQLARFDRWNPWRENVERYISPYHDSQDPEKEIKQIMKKIGFTDVEVVTKPMTFVFENVQLFKDAVTAINPFNIPKDMFNDFLDDMVNILRSMNETNNRGHNNETIYYNLLIVSGNK